MLVKTDVKKWRIQKITPFLWFNTEAEEAARFYISLFNDSKILNIARYPKEAEEASGMPEWSVMTVEFKLEWQSFIALNGGPEFRFTPAISFVVNCETRQEVDRLWERLSEWGKKSQCGWLDDKYWVSWQIVPTILWEFLADKDPVKSWRVIEAMLKMTKIDIDLLKKAYKG